MLLQKKKWLILKILNDKGFVCFDENGQNFTILTNSHPGNEEYKNFEN